jgi:hypothetical protein
MNFKNTNPDYFSNSVFEYNREHGNFQAPSTFT